MKAKFNYLPRALNQLYTPYSNLMMDLPVINTKVSPLGEPYGDQAVPTEKEE